MLAYKALKEILDRTIGWERELGDLLEVAGFGLTNKRSRDVVNVLVAHQSDILEVLVGIDLAAFGPAEWIQFFGDLKREELIPKRKIHKDTPADEIVSYIMEYEEALRDFYGRVADRVTMDSQKDLFQSLVTLKNAQIERISSL